MTIDPGKDGCKQSLDHQQHRAQAHLILEEAHDDSFHETTETMFLSQERFRSQRSLEAVRCVVDDLPAESMFENSLTQTAAHPAQPFHSQESRPVCKRS